MAWFIIRNFSYSFRIMYYFSRILCIIPFSIVHNPNSNIVTSKVRARDGVFFGIFIVLNLILFADNFLKTSAHATEMPLVLRFFGQIFLVLVPCYNIIMTIMNMYNRHKIIKIIKMFSAIAEEVTILIFNLNIFHLRKINFQ